MDCVAVSAHATGVVWVVPLQQFLLLLATAAAFGCVAAR
jgi:hypothetical protein